MTNKILFTEVYGDELQVICTWATSIILKLKSLPDEFVNLCFVVMDKPECEIMQLYLSDFGYNYETEVYTSMGFSQVHFKVYVR